MQKTLQLTVTITLAIAGIIHLIIAPEHYQHAVAHGLFFGVLGLGQLLGAGMFWQRQDRLLYHSAIALSGSVIFLWILTDLVVMPFSSHTHPVDWSLLVTKSSEAIALITLIKLMWPSKQLLWTGLLSMVLITLAVWGGSLALEQLIPSPSHTHDADEATPHDHDADEATPHEDNADEATPHDHDADEATPHEDNADDATPHDHDADDATPQATPHDHDATE